MDDVERRLNPVLIVRPLNELEDDHICYTFKRLYLMPCTTYNFIMTLPVTFSTALSTSLPTIVGQDAAYIPMLPFVTKLNGDAAAVTQQRMWPRGLLTEACLSLSQQC